MDNEEKDQDDQSKKKSSGNAMPFTEHLEELRKRLFRVIISVTVFTLIAYYFWETIFEIIQKPNPGVSLISLAPAQLFLVSIKLSFYAGVLLSIPVVVFQAWQFIAPGLYPKERRYIFPIIFFTIVCFSLGAIFAYSIVIPYGLQFFQSFETEGISNTWAIDKYISFVSMMIMIFGVVFEMPILALFLGKVGLINHKMMSKYRRYAIFGAFVLGAVLTPPDGFTQISLAIPLIILYEISIILVRIVGKKREEEDH